MTDGSATLRAMAERARKTAALCVGKEWLDFGIELIEYAKALDEAAVSQSSWAKEKADLERQLAEADRLVFEHLGTKPPDIDWPWHLRVYRESVARHRSRHASRPVTVKE